jgi:hypothetical protein
MLWKGGTESEKTLGNCGILIIGIGIIGAVIIAILSIPTTTYP